MNVRRRYSGGAALAIIAIALLAPAAAAQHVNHPDQLQVSPANPVHWPLAIHALESNAHILRLLASDSTSARPLLDERSMAGLWSSFIPGAGQFYKGENAKGALMLSAFTASLIYAVTAGIGEGELCSAPMGPFGQNCVPIRHDINSRFFIGLGSAAGVYVWSVVDAVRKR